LRIISTASCNKVITVLENSFFFGNEIKRIGKIIKGKVPPLSYRPFALSDDDVITCSGVIVSLGELK